MQDYNYVLTPIFANALQDSEDALHLDILYLNASPGR
jgi:hypothetical protein